MESNKGKPDLDVQKAARLAAPLASLLVAPIIFQTVKIFEQDHKTLKSDFIAASVTTVVCTTLMLTMNMYLKHHCQLTRQNQLTEAHQQRSFFYKLISILSSDTSTRPSTAAADNSNSSFSFLQSNKHDSAKKRIDSKYFKPKFIISELMTFWDTTCTVITWGSFYVIGGTVVATEKIAQKIKAKRTQTRDSSFNASFNSNGGTGHKDSFMSSFMSSGNYEPEPTTEPSQSFKKISSWTKRSFASVKRKFTRIVTLSVPQLTNLSMTSNSNSRNRD